MIRGRTRMPKPNHADFNVNIMDVTRRSYHRNLTVRRYVLPKASFLRTINYCMMYVRSFPPTLLNTVTTTILILSYTSPPASIRPGMSAFGASWRHLLQGKPDLEIRYNAVVIFLLVSSRKRLSTRRSWLQSALEPAADLSAN